MHHLCLKSSTVILAGQSIPRNLVVVVVCIYSRTVAASFIGKIKPMVKGSMSISRRPSKKEMKMYISLLGLKMKFQ